MAEGLYLSPTPRTQVSEDLWIYCEYFIVSDNKRKIYVAKTNSSEVGWEAIKGGSANSPTDRMRYYTPCAVTTLTPIVEDECLHTYGENVPYPTEGELDYDRFASYNNNRYSELNRSVVPEYR